MSFISIRCPNCAAAESLPIGENKYRCRYCDNTFNYVDTNASKVTKNITVQEVQSHHCPICGRGVTAGISNCCMKCGTNDLCSNCTFETPEKKLMCRSCFSATLDNCLICGNYSTFKCHSCIKLHEKDPSHVITRYCSEHLVKKILCLFGKYYGWACSHCGGLVCGNCVIVGTYNNKCRNCGNNLKNPTLIKDKDLKKANKSFAEWFTELSGLAESA